MIKKQSTLKRGLKESPTRFRQRQVQHEMLQEALKIIRENVKAEKDNAKSDPKFPGLKFDAKDNIVFHKPTGLLGVIKECRREQNPKRYRRLANEGRM